MAEAAAPRILISNDDGINAPGIKTLEAVARQISDDVWVVAPESNQSGAGHSLTLQRPLRIRRVSERHIAVDGTPTDCIMLALQHLVPRDRPVDLVLSGVNRGVNIADDVTYSGTVAAAMEATLCRVRAIAFSQCFDHGHPVKWATAEHWALPVIRTLQEITWPPGVLMNVNFPDRIAGSVEGIRVTRQGTRKIGDVIVERIDPRGEPYFWVGDMRSDAPPPADTDLHAIENGFVSVTPIHLDMTHHASLQALRERLK